MVRKEKCTAILLAAGKGTRMGSDVPKQFMNILGKPVLYYSLKCFQDSDFIDEVLLVTSEEMAEYCREKIVEPYGFAKVSRIIVGGAQRYDSVYEGLKCCENTDFVFIHDGARPFVTEEILQRGYDQVREAGACVAGVPAKDTVKITDYKGVVVDTPERTRVWKVQTPQIFAFHLIKKAYDRLQMFDKHGITDDAMVLEQMGSHPVSIFMGSYRNIKITTTEDLEIAEIFAKKH